MLPSGEYKGTVLPPFSLFNRLWKGKVFTGNKVKNIILGRERIEGDVYYDGSYPNRKVIINYPQLKVYDTLSPVDNTNLHWTGEMTLFGVRVKFKLDKER